MRSFCVLLACFIALGACAHAPSATPSTEPLRAKSANASNLPSVTTSRQDVGGSIAGTTPVRGARGALVTIVEFGDYECPFCARTEGTLAKLRELYGERVRFAFRHRPLSFHPHAHLAAEAAMAAQQQGNFWEMHDRLYAHSSNLSDEVVTQAARESGLDLSHFEADLREHTYRSLVDDESKHAEEVQAVGTPTFFINGRVINGAQPIERFQAVINDELRIVGDLAKLGVGADKLYDVRLASLVNEKVGEPRAAPAQPVAQKALITAGSPIRGPKLAKVTIVEYSDLRCPFCSRASATMKQLQAKYGNDVRIAYRHNPLPFHERARELSNMTVAAQAQGKFWEMVDYIFEHQAELPSDENGVSVARQLGLDVARYKRDLTSTATASRIDDDIAEAARIGAKGTPTFFINGHLVRGAQPIDVFERVIEDERKKAQALLDGGTSLQALYDKIMDGLPAAQP